jgi:hypothetical protein
MVRFLLNVVVFVSGAVLMGLEIVGSRVLAPYFGSSIFVWGSLISVVMTALSVGYYWGGWLSAREPSYARLLILLCIPGILIFFLPFIYPPVNEWVASVDFGIRLNRQQHYLSLTGNFFRNRLAVRHTLGRYSAFHRRQYGRNSLCSVYLRQHLRHAVDRFLLDTPYGCQ